MNSTCWPPAGVNLPKSALAVVSWFRSALFIGLIQGMVVEVRDVAKAEARHAA